MAIPRREQHIKSHVSRKEAKDYPRGEKMLIETDGYIWHKVTTKGTSRKITQIEIYGKSGSILIKCHHP